MVSEYCWAKTETCKGNDWSYALARVCGLSRKECASKLPVILYPSQHGVRADEHVFRSRAELARLLLLPSILNDSLGNVCALDLDRRASGCTLSCSSMGVLLYLLNCGRIIDPLTTVSALIELHGRRGVSLTLTSASHGLTNFLEMLIAAVRTNS